MLLSHENSIVKEISLIECPKNEDLYKSTGMQSELVAKMSDVDVMEVKELDLPSSLIKYTMGMVFYLLVDKK